MQRLGTAGRIEIIVLDVGQASAALIKRDGNPIGFFDFGAPIWFNKGSLPKAMSPPSVSGGFVILSHWDFDHFDLGRRHQPYRKLDWYAPDQPVGPNTARFQADLGNRLTFIDGPASGGGFSLERGTSTGVNDRNGSGYQLRFEKDGRAVLLTGDTGYDLIQTHMLAGVGALTVPHHAGRSDAAPPAAVDPWRAIASYGAPNSYRHPHGPPPSALLDLRTRHHHHRFGATS
jgi:beta-lactamase superfamily II metal-dependent hydrolase